MAMQLCTFLFIIKFIYRIQNYNLILYIKREPLYSKTHYRSTLHKTKSPFLLKKNKKKPKQKHKPQSLILTFFYLPGHFGRTALSEGMSKQARDRFPPGLIYEQLSPHNLLRANRHCMART